MQGLVQLRWFTPIMRVKSQVFLRKITLKSEIETTNPCSGLGMGKYKEPPNLKYLLTRTVSHLTQTETQESAMSCLSLCREIITIGCDYICFIITLYPSVRYMLLCASNVLLLSELETQMSSYTKDINGHKSDAKQFRDQWENRSGFQNTTSPTQVFLKNIRLSKNKVMFF